mmetsp:Transcript_59660/g.82832  ORF Transcript_59660/g.82832 Transcript_59660/m.82832 type:complete len:113 (+) Transcript_59660:90-428(+)
MMNYYNQYSQPLPHMMYNNHGNYYMGGNKSGQNYYGRNQGYNYQGYNSNNSNNSSSSQNSPRENNSSTFYSQAKHAEQVEKDLQKAEYYYFLAVRNGEKLESAIKDLATVLH